MWLWSQAYKKRPELGVSECGQLPSSTRLFSRKKGRKKRRFARRDTHLSNSTPLLKEDGETVPIGRSETDGSKQPEEQRHTEPREQQMGSQKEDELRPGTLVVAEYPEKRVMYNWPAMVYLSDYEILMKGCSCRTYDG